MAWKLIHRDPELWQYRYDDACQKFARGEMTEAVFGGTLYGLGYRGREIEAETNLHRPAREPNPHAGKKFCTGLP